MSKFNQDGGGDLLSEQRNVRPLTFATQQRDIKAAEVMPTDYVIF